MSLNERTLEDWRRLMQEALEDTKRWPTSNSALRLSPETTMRILIAIIDKVVADKEE